MPDDKTPEEWGNRLLSIATVGRPFTQSDFAEVAREILAQGRREGTRAMQVMVLSELAKVCAFDLEIDTITAIDSDAVAEGIG